MAMRIGMSRDLDLYSNVNGDITVQKGILHFNAHFNGSRINLKKTTTTMVAYERIALDCNWFNLSKIIKMRNESVNNFNDISLSSEIEVSVLLDEDDNNSYTTDGKINIEGEKGKETISFKADDFIMGCALKDVIEQSVGLESTHWTMRML